MIANVLLILMSVGTVVQRSGVGAEENFYYLTDALGSVGALADDYGDVVERYAYDPYGATLVLDANGNPAQAAIGGVAKPVDETASIFYHDHDGDGDIDGADEADLWACATNGFDIHCVYHHDRDGDRVVDIIDLGVFYGFEDFDTSGTAAPTIFGRPPPNSFDWDGDGRIDLYDYHAFAVCSNVSITTNSQPCAVIFDSDADQNITTNDLAAMVAAQTSPGEPTWQNLINASQYGNPFAYTGQRYDPITGLYHFWARTYDPVTSRWMQRDMMGPLAAMDIMLGSGGGTPYVMPSFVSGSSEFANGFNLFAYVGLGPINRFDPLGLYYDDDVDDLIADNTGHRLYALGELNEGAKWASIGLQTTLGIAASLLPGAGLYDAFKSVQVIASGGGGFWDAFNIATAAFPLAHGAMKLIGLKSIFKARMFRFRGCNSFVRGTMIETDTGPVPIEDVRPGDWILTMDQNDPSETPQVRTVSRIHRGIAPAILWVTLASGVTMGLTPEHEVWSYQDGWTTAATINLGDALITASGESVEVTSLCLDRTPTKVYNFEVQSTHTYFANDLWVHNAKCSIARSGRAVDDALDALSGAWHRGTFSSRKDSFKYHWKRHAEGRGISPEEYAQDAQAFWQTSRSRAQEWPIGQGGQGTGFKIDGKPGGIFTSDGKIVTFWYD